MSARPTMPAGRAPDAAAPPPAAGGGARYRLAALLLAGTLAVPGVAGAAAPRSTAAAAAAAAPRRAEVAAAARAAGLDAEPGPARRVRALDDRLPAGVRPEALAYAPGRDLLYVLLPPREGSARIVALTRFAEPAAAAELPLWGLLPPRLAYDPRGERLLLWDDVAGRLFELGLGADGAPDPATLRALETPRVGPLRAAGLAVDRSGRVHLLDRLSRRILRFTPRAPGEEAAGRGDAVWIGLGPLAARELRGIAHDPIEDHFHLLEPEPGILWEITPAGRLVAAVDLGGSGVREPHAPVLAPSADQTDDPAILGLIVADAAGGTGAAAPGLVELSIAAQEPVVVPTAGLATLVRVVDTSAWGVPSPDPSGMSYDAGPGRLLMVDGEVDEERYWRNVNYYELALDGTYLRGADLSWFTIEPVGVALNTRNGHLLISDDDQRRVFDLDPGPDRLVGTADDRVTGFDTRAFGCGDPEGLAYDSLANRLFVADGVNSEIYQILPGPDGRFDGVNDVVTHFDVARLGVRDPECVEFDPRRGTLFTIGSGEHTLVEIGVDGALIQSWDVSHLDLQHGAGLACAPGSADSRARHFYLSDRAVDNDSDSSENDGKIFELSLAGAAVPPPPPPVTGGTTFRIASGNDDAEEKASGSVSLSGSDLELVEDGSLQTVALRFTQVAIPRRARVDSAFIQFDADESHAGPTVLRIAAQAVDDAPPLASSRGNLSARPRTAAFVTWTPSPWTAGQAGAAQRTPDLAPVLQEIVSRDGWESGNDIVILFTGSGRRTATAWDGDPAVAPVLAVSVGVGPVVNRPPVVDAGPDRVAHLPAAGPAVAALDASVADDGLPAAVLATRWRQIDGPAVATFADDRAVDTSVELPALGRYRLELEAADGAAVTADTVAVDVVVAPPAPPVTVERRVAAGVDDAEQKGTSVSTSSSDLELVTDGSVQTVGLRFTGLGLPRDARIERAWIQFKADESQNGPMDLTLRAEASDAAATYASARPIVGRPLGAAAVSWRPLPWTAGLSGDDQRTPDLAALIQELVRRPGWTPASPVSIVITGTGHRTARSYEGEAAASPLLHVEYRSP